MKRYIFSQWIKRISTSGALLLFVFGIGYSIWYLFSKPSQSKIALTSFSQIAFDDLACDSFTASTTPFANQFPLFLSYQPSQARLSLTTDTDYYFASLRIINAEHVFVTTKRTIGGEETSNETKLLSPDQNVLLEIKADRFSWGSPISSDAFDEVKNIVSPGAFPDYSDVTCDFTGDCLGDPIEEFDWIPQDPRFIYNIGVCGENLRYVSRYKSATLDDLNSIGIDIIPLGNGKTAWVMMFTDYVGKDFIKPTREDTTVRIIFNSPVDFGNEGANLSSYTPSMNILFAKLSDHLIAIGDAMTNVSPGLVLNVDYLDKQNVGNPQPQYGFPVADEIKIKTNRIFVDSPKGAIVANFPKISIPEGADQLLVYSTSKPLEFSFKDSSYFSNKYEILEERIGATVDGREFIPSPWESIPREIQVAYITVFIPLLAALIGYGIQKRKEIDAFYDWIFSIPRYRRQVKLHDDAHIFQLINGKKISGIIDTFEGKSTFRVFVLKEVREWDKDNWSDVLPTEVRVPQNQIEMYYKALP